MSSEESRESENSPRSYNLRSKRTKKLISRPTVKKQQTQSIDQQKPQLSKRPQRLATQQKKQSNKNSQKPQKEDQESESLSSGSEEEQLKVTTKKINLPKEPITTVEQEKQLIQVKTDENLPEGSETNEE